MIKFRYPIIFLSNLVKVAVINLADLINRVWNPFDKFVRPTVLKYVEALDVKAQKFEQVLSRFYDQNIVYNSTINWDNTPDDVGDQSLFHGITVAMWALKYSTTRDSSDLEKIRQGMVGLDLHQTAHGESVRRLIRGVVNPLDPKNTFIDDVSNDGVTGHLLGIYYAWLYGDADIQQKSSILIQGLADELLNHTYCLVGPDGNPTTYGKLIDGWKTNPLCLTLCMAILLVANQITAEDKYAAAYNEVHDIYGSADFYKYPKVSFLTFNNWNDDHRAAIHLSILADFPAWDEGGNFKKGLARIWRLNKETGNAWIAYLVGRHIDIKTDTQPCLTLLNEFYAEDLNNVQKINSTDPGLLASQGIYLRKYSPLPFLKGGLVSSQPCPLWWTGAQEFRFQRRPYSVDDWAGYLSPTLYFFSVDFLISYWGFKQLGWL